jgi:hypothetical protein
MSKGYVPAKNIIGTDVQAWGDILDDLNTLGAAASDGQFIVATGAGTFAYEATTTARTSLGVGAGDSPQFTGIELGHASDTTLTRVSAGVLAIEGVNVVTTSSTSTLTNKTFDANGTGNSLSNVDLADLSIGAKTESIIIAASDETTALETGAAKTTFRMPYAFTLTDVRASVTTAPTGATLTVDIHESGTTVLSTKITIDATEKTSTTAVAAPVIGDAALADDAEITIDIDQIGSSVAGAGLKVYLIGYQT